MDLKQYFYAITPENIRDIPLIQTAMDIFIANLEENSRITSDIKRLYITEYKQTDSVLLQNTKLNVRKGLLAVYLSNLYNVLSKAQSDKAIKAKFDTLNISSAPFMTDVEKIINDEYFIANKTFKENIGTIDSIKYIYNLTEYLELATHSNDFTLTELKPFHIRTTGSVFTELYENIVKPLAHPIGFAYEYMHVLNKTFSDLFGIMMIYDVAKIELRNIDGLFHVFTGDSNDVNVKADFLTRVNPLTNKLFTLSEYNAQVTVYTNKIINTFNDSVVDGRSFRSIVFTDGTYLEQYTNPIAILYTTYSNFLANSYAPLYDYSGHWSLYTEYTTDWSPQYTDMMSSIATSAIDENFLLTDDTICSDDFFSYMSSNAYYLVGDEGILPYVATDNYYLVTNNNQYLTTTL